MSCVADANAIMVNTVSDPIHHRFVGSRNAVVMRPMAISSCVDSVHLRLVQ